MLKLKINFPTQLVLIFRHPHKSPPVGCMLHVQGAAWARISGRHCNTAAPHSASQERGGAGPRAGAGHRALACCSRATQARVVLTVS